MVFAGLNFLNGLRGVTWTIATGLAVHGASSLPEVQHQTGPILRGPTQVAPNMEFS